MIHFLPLLLVFLPFVPALISFALPDRMAVWRDVTNISFALIKLGLVGFLLLAAREGVITEWRYEFLPGHDFILRADSIALLFVTLSAFLWLITTVFAIGYFGRGPHLARFFGFFNLCVLAATGVAMSGTTITFFLFYELLTLATWPLVVHRGDEKSLRAGRIYLIYTLAGSAAYLAGIVWLSSLVGRVEFTAPPDLSGIPRLELTLIFILCIGGLGVKAALIPFHGWLPEAMAAPAPVSALLHAVAVVKAGAFGILRIIYDVFGIETVSDLGLATPLAMLSLGCFLAQIDLRECFTDLEIWKVSVVRLLLIPAIAIVLLLFIPLDHMSKIILLTGTAAPCALASAMFGQIYGTDYLFSTRVISLSTLLSVITLPLCISVLEGLLHFFG